MNSHCITRIVPRFLSWPSIASRTQRSKLTMVLLGVMGLFSLLTPVRVDGGYIYVDGFITFTNDTAIGPAFTEFDGQNILVVVKLTVSGRHTFNNVVVKSGGILTHLPAAENNLKPSLDLTITSNLIVDVGSRIDVTGCGYWDDDNGNAHTLGGMTNGAATGGSGGSYGGLGAVNGDSFGVAYGDYRNPNEVGSSGAGGRSQGGSGGGLVRITARNVQVDGAILAGGADGQCGAYRAGGGGSGGGILLNVETLTGSGTIAANGGNQGCGTEAGGGGRVAILYTSVSGFNLSSNVAALGGTGGNGAGAVGTVYLQQTNQLGQLLLNNHGMTTGSWTPLGGLTDAVFQVDNLVIVGTGVVAATYSGCPIQANSLTISNGADLTHQQGYSLQLTIASNLWVDAASRIDVSGCGYWDGGDGNGHTVGGTTNGAATGTSGGSYGGLGVPQNGTPGVVYGDYRNPNELGSSGAGERSQGGSGGGLVRITAGSAQVDGAILARGVDGQCGAYRAGGGGSGGGILINVGTLTGSGTIAANGGNQGCGTEAGGGGRVAIYTWANMFLPVANLMAKGGTGGNGNGQTGSVWISSSPYCIWNQSPVLLHGTKTFSWIALGIDPRLLSVEVVAAEGGLALLDTVIRDTGLSGSINWDTTPVPDTVYELQAIFRNGANQVVGQLSQAALVNNSVTWHGGTLTASEIWLAGSVHVVEQTLITPSGITLTIQPGAVVKFATGTGITVQSGGILNVLATADAPIVFTALADDTAGGDTNLDGDRSVPIAGSWQFAVQGTGQVNSTAFTDLRYLMATHSGVLAISEVWRGDWVHLVTGSLTITNGLSVTIQPGAIVKFDSGAGINVQAGGSLIAQGTGPQPITFTSLKDDSVGGDSNGDGDSTTPAAGDWRSIVVQGGTLVVAHVRIQYGGGDASGYQLGDGAISPRAGAQVSIANTLILDSFYEGVACYGGGTVSISNSVVANADRGINADGAVVNLFNCTLDKNRIGFWPHGGTINAVNCIVSRSLATGVVGGSLQYCDVWSAIGNNGAFTPGVNGNISVDPKFKNPDDGDYHLTYGSPCIDAADSTVAPPTDIMGAPRYNDPRTLVKTGIATNGVYADMGAFEFVENAVSPIDLIGTTVFGPVAVTAGQTGTVQWTVANIGTGTAVGPWHDAIALATMDGSGNTLWVGDPLVGQGVVLGPGQSYTASVTVTVPGGTAGNYRWQVHVNSQGDIFEGANWTNNIALADTPTSLTDPVLTVGGLTLTNTFSSDSQPYWFMFTPQTNVDIQISLSLASGASGAVGLYVGQGFMPTPQNFTFQQSQWNSPTVTALVASPSTQPYYILVDPLALATTPSTFTIGASMPGFALTSVFPTVVANNEDTSSTLKISGSQLTGSMTYQVVDPNGGVHNALAVTVVNSSEVYASFDFFGLPNGAYSVKVAGQTGLLTNAFIAKPFISTGQFEPVSITGPDTQRSGRPATLVVNYYNPAGVDDIPMLIFLKSDNGLFRLPGQTTWVSNDFALLGINQEGPANIIPPGYQGQITVEFSQATPDAVSQIYYTTVPYGIGPSNPVWWNADDLRPPFQPQDSWSVIYSNFLAKYGQEFEAPAGYPTRTLTLVSYGDLQALLVKNATHLDELGEKVFDVSQLLSYEFQQCGNFGAIAARYRLGAFGRGMPDPADLTVTNDAASNVVIISSGRSRYFMIQPDGTYHALPGDYGVLTKRSTGGFQVREKNGLLTAFRTDGRLDYTQDTNGNRLTANYSSNLIVGFTDNFGDRVSYTYDGNGRITQMTDPVGRVTTYTYDAADAHLLQVSNAVGTVSFTWVTGQGAAREHAIASLTYVDGTHTYYQYDAQGRLVSQTSDGGTELITYAYDDVGNLTITDAAGRTTITKPNEFNQIAAIQDALGITTKFTFDADHNLTRAQNSGGQATTLFYDDFGNTINTVDSLGQNIGVTYESTFNQPTGMTDPLGHTLGMAYDASGNETASIFADSTRDQYTYDAAGNVTAWTSRRGKTTHYAYDAHNLLTVTTLPGGSTRNYTYDAHRNCTAITDTNGTIAFTYDSADRMTQVTYPGSRFLQFAYDTAGRRTSMIDQDGFTTRYSYDARAYLARLADGSGNPIVSYNYDDIGRLASKVRGNGVVSAFTYTPTGLLQSITNRTASGTVLSSFNYGYDALGRVTSMTTLAGTFTYGYDGINQLTTVTAPGGRVITYQYDGAGNRTVVSDTGTNTTYMANVLNQYTSTGCATFQYDAGGNLISKTTAAGTTAYTYDDQDQLVSIVATDGTWQYEYDALGQRSAVIHNGQRTEYLLDPFGLSDVVGEYGVGSAVHYTYGLDLASRVDASGHPSYYDFDASANTADLTDSSGALLNSYSYLPFGEKLSATGSTPNPFTFVGQFGVADGGEGFYFMRNRWYDPAAGRFTQLDPLGLGGGSVNLYSYVGNSPAQYVDPTGTQGVPRSGSLTSSSISAGSFGRQNISGLAPQVGEMIGKPGLVLSEQAVRRKAANKAVEAGSKSLLQKFVAKVGIKGVLIKIGLKALPFINIASTIYDVGQVAEIIEEANQSQVSNDWNPYADPDGIWGPKARSFGGGNAKVRGKAIRFLNSLDPNDKIGSGFGAQGFVTADGSLMYTIDFENVSNATAAAQQVVVTDQLDSNLDWSTLQLQTIAFNNAVINVPAGLQNYSTQTHVATDPNPVNVNAAFNPTTGMLTWTMTSIDPVTGQLVTDPLAGFLPPDNNSHAGEGYLTYSVRPKSGLTNGAVIHNQASIVFDVNAPIVTPVVTNTIDSVAPQSTVQALPTTITNTQINVRWSGSDTNGSGVQSYTIYVSTNGTAYVPWLSTTNTSGIYTGQVGKTYTFYSVALDNAGNPQIGPAIAEATTTLMDVLQITASPTVTNALALINHKAVVVAGTTNIFRVTAVDQDSLSLAYRWTFGDGTNSDWLATNIAAHVYPTNNCGPYAASVTVSNGYAAVSSNLTVITACDLTITKLQLGVNFAKTGADTISLTAKPDLPGITNAIQLYGASVVVDVGGAQVPFLLNNKGRGVSTNGTCVLAYTKPSKKVPVGYWTATLSLSKGNWRTPWANYGLTNVTVKNVSVTVPVMVQVYDEAFAADPPLHYSATQKKSGTAK